MNHAGFVCYSPPPSPLLLPVDKSTDYPNYYQGLWDCTGDFPDELSFRRGDTIYVLSKVSPESLLARRGLNISDPGGTSSDRPPPAPPFSSPPPAARLNPGFV